MAYPVVTLKSRKLGYKFMCAEAWWILTGQNTVETIKPYSKEIERFSDDGVYYNGAYGPRIIDQLTYAVDCLAKDPSSRQAVIEIWRPNPRDSRDIPCTISVQFLIRDNHLHCIDSMRSSDIWLGWPYDIFNFTMLSARIRELLIKRDPKFTSLRLGTITLNAGSQHIYRPDVKGATECIDSSEAYTSTAFDPRRTPSIIDYLSMMKDWTPNVNGGFLNDLFVEKYAGA